MEQSFNNVFTGLGLDMSDRALLDSTQVIKVSVSSKRDTLTVYVKRGEELPSVTIRAAEDAIRDRILGHKAVKVQILQLAGGTARDGVASQQGGSGYQGAGDTPPWDRNRQDNPAGISMAGVAADESNVSGTPGTVTARVRGEAGGGGVSAVKNQSGAGGQSAARMPKKPGQTGFRRSENRWTPKTDKKSQNPDIIFGYDFKGEALSISSLEEGMGEVIIRGRIFGNEQIKTRNGKYIISFNLTDDTDSITCKLFCDENTKNAVEAGLRDGSFVCLSGTVEPPGQYNREITISRIKGIVKSTDPDAGRTDSCTGDKRVELDLHTKMSDMDGITDIGTYIRLADKWGWKALAITDTNSVQAFPTAAHSLPRDSGLKLIYGVTGSLVNDDKNAVYKPRGQSLDGEFVVFDIETTGFSMKKDRIIEIGAVKIRGGLITDRFSEFIDPEMPVPRRITELTTITDSDVKGAGNYEYWIPRFLEFVGDVPVVGHNAMFDVGFIKSYAQRLGLEFDPTVLDTLGLSHMLLKKLFRNKLDTIAKELGVTLTSHHRAVADAEATAGIFLAFVKILKDRGITELDGLWQADEMDAATIKKLHPCPFTMLALNDLGRTNMYRLVSAAHVDYLYHEPRMPKSLVASLRDGLLIGSGNEEGELYDETLRGVGDDEILHTAEFYDYLEIVPPSNISYLINDPGVPVESMQDIYDVTKRIVEIADRLGKPVVAAGNTHFAKKGESIYRRIIKYFEYASKGRRFNEEKYSAELYLRTTDEMLKEFDFLGNETAYRAVVTNPGRIADMCERIAPVRPDKCPPVIENSDKELRDKCYETARAMYGDRLPAIVEERLEKELNSIISNGYSVMYIIAKRLVEDSMEHGFLVGSRGSVGSSLAAFFGGISEVNPLPPHYRCPKCRYIDFDSETVNEYRMRSGYDMPDMSCPKCGEKLIRDGFDIPFETFLGFKGDKEPDIDLNFAGEYQPKAHAYTEVLFGEGQTYKAGTIGTIQKKTAYGYVLRYNSDHEEMAKKRDPAARIKPMRRAEMDRLSDGCTEVRRTTGQHPGGIIVLPHGEEMTTFTPIQYPANDDSNMVTTHFDYHSIDHNLLKLDILGKDDPSMVRMLEELTGTNAMELPVGTPEVMSLFKDTSALGITPDDIGGTPLGTMGIPEFGTDFAMQMLKETKPRYVSDLVRIAGLAHGTDVWLGNAQKLINEGTCTIDKAICTRDDIMIYLISMGMEPGMSFKIMELVRKGKFPKDPGHEKYCEEMRKHGVPDWYIWSCDTIKYMFPKAHAAAYVVMSLRIAYYKVHYPLEYYAAYFTVKGKGYDYERMCVSLPVLRQNLGELKERLDNTRDATANDRLLYRDMRIAEEMMARGLKFAPIDIFRARARVFTITPDRELMPSLDSISGLGQTAAASVEADAVNGQYLSMEEFISRTRVTRTNAELMKRLGLLGGIPESNQLSFFDLGLG